MRIGGGGVGGIVDGEVGDYYGLDGEDNGLVGDDDNGAWDGGEGEDIGSDCEGWGGKLFFSIKS